jgi:hypothetical protein
MTYDKREGYALLTCVGGPCAGEKHWLADNCLSLAIRKRTDLPRVVTDYSLKGVPPATCAISYYEYRRLNMFSTSGVVTILVFGEVDALAELVRGYKPSDEPVQHPDRQGTQHFVVLDFLIRYCGRTLTADTVDELAAKLRFEMQEGPCSWAFKETKS